MVYAMEQMKSLLRRSEQKALSLVKHLIAGVVWGYIFTISWKVNNICKYYFRFDLFLKLFSYLDTSSFRRPPCLRFGTDIFDLRTGKDIQDFKNTISLMLEDKQFLIDNIESEEEKIILLRAMLIGFYAERCDKKLVVGIFEQREQSKFSTIKKVAADLKIVFGVETIYCVKDAAILHNIR